MVGLNPTIYTITLSVNGLNIPVKRQKMSDWIRKVKTQLYAVYKTPTLNIKTQIS